MFTTARIIVLSTRGLFLWITWVASAQAAGLPALEPVPIRQVCIEDDFWSPKLQVWREVTLPDCFTKFEQEGALANFDKVAQGSGGSHEGPPWYDGLVYEMICASAEFLAAQPDPELEARLDGYVQRIAAAAAQDPDGYLNTYTQLEEPDRRWGLNGGNLRWQHDLYNAGAMVEAAVQYYRATGKTDLLQVATRLANCMTEIMGPPPRQNIIPGHALGEEAMVDLYQLFREQPQLKSRLAVPVQEERYLELAGFWIGARGHHEGRASLGAYNQDDVPVQQQETIEGHAVRALLLCCGLVAVGEATNNPDYLAIAQRLWNNLVSRRMYLTGGAGAERHDEKFGLDYSLPNTGYAETCASVAAAFFHHRMNLAFGEARYADELERVLYNGVLCGVSLSGNRYFYENPLAAGKDRTRWSWHACPCCPPMFLKVMAALPGLVYAQDSSNVCVNLFIGSRADLVVHGTEVALRQTTRYPWEDRVRLRIDPERPSAFALKLRLPGWCTAPELRLNGRRLTQVDTAGGYASLTREWQRGDAVELFLPMSVERIYANPRVEADRGRVALQRGPLIHCLEGCDNGGAVGNIVIPPGSPLSAQWRGDLLDGVTVIQGAAWRLEPADWNGTLYQPGPPLPGTHPMEFLAIPYFANANRQPTEMRVWMAENPVVASPSRPLGPADRAVASASHCWTGDAVDALNDRVEPAASDDTTLPRFTWWDHRGTTEWVQYDFERPETVSAVEVYWWDERRIQAHCRVPQSWRLLYRDDTEWMTVPDASAYGTEMDRYNRVTFRSVDTPSLRLEVQLQPGWSGGILEWRVEGSAE